MLKHSMVKTIGLIGVVVFMISIYVVFKYFY